MKYKVLIADDEITICHILKTELIDQGYEVLIANDGKEAIEICKNNKIDAALLDINMPYFNGLKVLEEIKKTSKRIAIIMMTAFGTIDGAVKAMKMQADDYLVKPFDNRELLDKLEQLLQVNSKYKQLEININEIKLIGNSQLINEIKTQIEKIKDLNTTVLITGESGTGKGVVAKEIHNSGMRKKLPFIHINCAFLPTNLIESELFGHEKGSFTNADYQKKGKFELAEKGTIFLDEIGTLPLNLQAKLLTVLQDRVFERVGGTKQIKMDARIIAATNENIELAVKNKEFREDLYYRLNVFRIECPPLRYRKDDIKDFTKLFLLQHNKNIGKNIELIENEVWQLLMNYDWPGNVRELENVLESAVVLADENILTVNNLPIKIRKQFDRDTNVNIAMTTDLSLKEQEMMAIISALEKHEGHREKTAKELGISRRTLQYKLKRFNINM